ncbi:MAG: hypothetical protein IJP92_06065 [Lachnospiraceae bacterium]|nr:hypothetical protein [Lachnospiraceae bacterium]
MGRIRNQMISVRDLLRKMRSHAVISVLSAVGLATIGCGFVVFSAIGGLDTATYETEVIEGDQVTVQYGDDRATKEFSGMLQMVHEAVEDVKRQASANYIAVEEVDNSVSDTGRRTQEALESTAAKIDGLTLDMGNSVSAMQEIGRKVDDVNRAGEGFFQRALERMNALDEAVTLYGGEFAGVNNGIADVDRDVTTLQQNLAAFGDIVNGQFTSSDDKLNRLLEQLEQSNQNIIVLQTQLNEARQEIETLKSMVTSVGDAQNALNTVITQTEIKRVEDYDALKNMIDTNAQNISNVSNRVPFALGIDGDGEYGYVKEGADTVIPFRRPGQRTGETVSVTHRHAEGTACYRTEVSTTRTVQGRCGGGMKVSQYSNCAKCHEGAVYCASNPVCAADNGSHSVGAAVYLCTDCGAPSLTSASSCDATVKVPAMENILDCSQKTCGAMYIENGETRTGRRECPLTVVCNSDGAGMQVVAYAWSAKEKGVISSSTNTATVTAAHNGVYSCIVTVRDSRSGLEYREEVIYRVANLIK